MAMDEEIKREVALDIVDNLLNDGVAMLDVVEHRDMEYATEFDTRDVLGIVHDILHELRGNL